MCSGGIKDTEFLQSRVRTSWSNARSQNPNPPRATEAKGSTHAHPAHGGIPAHMAKKEFGVGVGFRVSGLGWECHPPKQIRQRTARIPDDPLSYGIVPNPKP